MVIDSLPALWGWVEEWQEKVDEKEKLKLGGWGLFIIQRSTPAFCMGRGAKSEKSDHVIRRILASPTTPPILGQISYEKNGRILGSGRFGHLLFSVLSTVGELLWAKLLSDSGWGCPTFRVFKRVWGISIIIVMTRGTCSSAPRSQVGK